MYNPSATNYQDKRKERRRRECREKSAARSCPVCGEAGLPFHKKYHIQCANSRKLERYQVFYEKVKEKGFCVNCRVVVAAKDCTECVPCKLRGKALAKERGRALKLETFEAYGGAKCYCCGETILQFLSLDHINDDGYKEAHKGRKLYEKLKKLGWPPGLRVACHNCNLGRHINGGVCPHVNGV